MVNLLKVVITVAVITINVFGACAQVLSGTGKYLGPEGFDRGFQATQYLGNWPESWLRGSAFLNKQTGMLNIWIGLETDATFAGPKGQVHVYIKDANGNLLTRVTTAEVGRGGKMPGSAAINNFQATIHVGSDIASRAASLEVIPYHTGFIDRWFNITLEQLTDAAGYIQQFAMFFF
jgi:hypothetical protein